MYQMGVDHESLRYTSITVYDPDGQTQEFQKWKARRRTPSGPEILWVAPGSGEYYFAVQNFGGENGPYTLVITAVEDAADDHGDNLATATGISLDETVEGTVDSDFDFDYFRFEAVEGRAYLIDVTGETLQTIPCQAVQPLMGLRLKTGMKISIATTAHGGTGHSLSGPH